MEEEDGKEDTGYKQPGEKVQRRAKGAPKWIYESTKMNDTKVSFHSLKLINI